MKQGFIFLIVGLLLAGTGYSQNTPEVIGAAFKTSIESEIAGEYSKAIEAIQQVYSEDSYEQNLRMGWLNYQAGSFTESAAYYERACKLMPLSIEAKMGFVMPAAALGSWPQIETKYREVLAIDPHNSLVNYRMGQLHYGREDYAGAHNYFEAVVNHYPFDKNGVLMLGWTNLRLGKNREAKVLFQKVLWIDADNASATEGLGMIR